VDTVALAEVPFLTNRKRLLAVSFWPFAVIWDSPSQTAAANEVAKIREECGFANPPDSYREWEFHPPPNPPPAGERFHIVSELSIEVVPAKYKTNASVFLTDSVSKPVPRGRGVGGWEPYEPGPRKAEA
jgi:hypothetical protein